MMNDINEDINLPPLTIIKEVTDDPYYDNRVMAELSKSNKQKTLIKPINHNYLLQFQEVCYIC